MVDKAIQTDREVRKFIKRMNERETLFEGKYKDSKKFRIVGYDDVSIVVKNDADNAEEHELSIAVLVYGISRMAEMNSKSKDYAKEIEKSEVKRMNSLDTSSTLTKFYSVLHDYFLDPTLS